MNHRLSILFIAFLFLFSKEIMLSYDNTQNPIQISSASDLTQLCSSTIDWNKNFIQTTNIDCSWATFSSIGNDSRSFTGNYNGQGFTISNFAISSTASNVDIGLFGYAIGSNLININLNNFTITNTTGNSMNIASLCAYLDGGIITNCHVSSGTITANPSNNSWAGGLIGGIINSHISNCTATGMNITSYSAGGLINWSDGYCTITDSYASNNILVSNFESAGFIGYSEYDEITNCYATNFTITGNNDCLGGFAGYLEFSIIRNCNSTSGSINISEGNYYIGSFVGYSNNCTYYSCYSNVSITSLSDHFSKGDYGGFVGNSFKDNFTYCKGLGDMNIVGHGRPSNYGGFVGYANSSTFSQVYSTNVLNISNEDNIGGFAGYLYYSYVTNCYTQNSIGGNDNWVIGGFVGYNEGSSISYCYSAVSMNFTSSFEIGGFCGEDDGSVSYLCCFWDKDIISIFPIPADNGYSDYDISTVYDCTTAEMKQAVTYLSHSCAWNFSNIWESHDGSDYPTLISPTIIATPTLTAWSRYILIFSVLLFGCYFVYRRVYA